MPEHHHYHDDAIVNAETHHEKSDVNVRALLWFVVIFIIFAAVTHLLLMLLFKGYVHIGRQLEKGKPVMTEIQTPKGIAPPLPRLQPLPGKNEKGEDIPPYHNTPATDMAEMRAAEDAVLLHSGWVDKQKGVMHIPIEDAKRIALQRGYPVTADASAPAAAATPSVQTGQANTNDANAATNTAAPATTTNPSTTKPNEPQKQP